MKPFTHLLRVRYSECDAQAIVFNGKYADYADIASTEFTRRIWGDYNSMLERGLDNQVVSLKIDWKSPARFDDVLAIEVELNHIGNTSFSLSFNFYQAVSRKQVASASITYVFLDTNLNTKVAIPDDMRNALVNGAAGQLCNHAGIEL